MSKIIVHSGLRVSQSPYGGFGVFTDEPIKENAIVEQCPALSLTGFDITQLPPLLQRYVYNWAVDGKLTEEKVALLGNGMIYNHNDKNNLLYRSELLIVGSENKMVITFFAGRDIEKGEELFSNYGEKYFSYFNIDKIN